MKLSLKGCTYVGTVMLALGLICHAQTQHPIAKPDTPKIAADVVTKPAEAAKPAAVPAVSDAVKLRFFKAEFEFQTANEQATQATQAVREKQAALQGVVKELEMACGAKYQPSMSQTRDPECIVKPEPPKPQAAKK